MIRYAYHPDSLSEDNSFDCFPLEENEKDPIGFTILVLKSELDKVFKALDKIDWHIRQMRVDGEITMKQMAVALKVISDNLK